MSWRPKITWAGVGRLAFVYIALCAFMWLAQRSLMYIPDTSIESPTHYGLTDFSETALTTQDNQTVYVWYRKTNAGFPTVIHFHGNAGNLSHRTHFFAALAKAGFGVLALDYRGYGKSTGSPSEEGFYHDASAVLHHATHDLSLPQSSLILYGESIGTGVAMQMATQCDCGALVLQSPYTSVEKVAQETYPWLPVSLLIKDRFDSISKVEAVKEPTLLMHGEKDNVIDVSHGRELFAQLGEPKQAVYFPAKGHNDLDAHEMVKLIIAFSQSQGLIARSEY